jgi:hypothetical protein
MILELIHRYNLTLNEVDCQKVSMMSAHICGDLVYNHTSERSPTATLAKRAYHHHHHHHHHYYDSGLFYLTRVTMRLRMP